MAPSLVIIRRVAEGYYVDVEPPLPDGVDRSRTFADKIGAWSFAQGLWTQHKLGCVDETDGHGGRECPHRSHEKYRSL